MSLTAADMKPWHLRARYSTFSPDGKPMRQGVVEIWWASPDHYKVSTTEGGSSGSTYHNGQSILSTGSKVHAVTDVPLLMHPLPRTERLDKETFTVKDTTVGTNSLHCLTESPKETGAANAFVSTYCFDPALPLLRVRLDSFGGRTVWNGIVTTHGHYAAKQITVSRGDTPQYKLEVDVLEPQLGIAEAELVAPADAEPVKHGSEAARKIALSSDTTAGLKIGGYPPAYPSDALAARIQGTVVLQATISKEGTPENLHVVSGPPMLQGAALYAVRTWRYRPYRLNGEPIEVETTVNVAFHLGN